MAAIQEELIQAKEKEEDMEAKIACSDKEFRLLAEKIMTLEKQN